MDSAGMDALGGWFHDGVIHEASKHVGRGCQWNDGAGYQGRGFGIVIDRLTVI